MTPYRRNWKDVEPATYSVAPLPHHRGNLLIEALPPQGKDAELAEALRWNPPFHPDERGLDNHLRLAALETLSNFMVPMERHIALARFIEGRIRHGYLGRAPETAAYVARLNDIERSRQDRTADFMDNCGANLAGALIGLSGTAKSTTLANIRRLYPRIIDHEALGIYQIPILPFSFPADGHSLKGPLASILATIERWAPDTQYASRHSLDRVNVSQLPAMLAAVLHRFNVGMLIADEVQNSQNAPKGKPFLAALLEQLSNSLGVPILFVGTNRAGGILSTTLASARRSLIPGVEYWDRFSWNEPNADGTPVVGDEWTAFFRALWNQQWVRNVTPYSPIVSKTVYELCQGIPDLAITLFKAAQYEAILNGTERVSITSLKAVAARQFAPIARMLRALETSDHQLLAEFDDLTPLRLRPGSFGSEFWAGSNTTVRGAAVHAGDPLFANSVADGLQAVGVPAGLSHQLAAEVEFEHPTTDAVGGLRFATKKLRTRRANRPKEKQAPVDLGDVREPEDLRQALLKSRTTGAPVVDELKAMGVVPNLAELLGLQ